jgi:hypothetical protein
METKMEWLLGTMKSMKGNQALRKKQPAKTPKDTKSL